MDTLLGQLDTLRLNTAITLAVGMEVYEALIRGA